MPAQITDDLQSVLDSRNPEQVNILVEAIPGQGDEAADALSALGLSPNRVDVRNKTVFETTVTLEQLRTLQEDDAILRLDYSPSFSPLGARADLPPLKSALPETADAVRTDSYTVTQELGVEDAWEKAGSRGEGAKIGMVDSPIDAQHRVITDSVADTAAQARGSGNDHGTWVAGMMVGGDTETRGGRVRGVAPEAELYSHGALSGGGASVGEISEGIEYCLDQDCDVINLSLGGPHSSVLHSIIQEARDNGALVVSSAGNAGPGTGTVSCPAHHDETISVGSIQTETNSVAAFSSRGPGYPDAPQKPDVMAYGGASRIGIPDQQIVESVLGPGSNGNFVYLLGTSMAAPQTTASAALRVSGEREGDL